ncbi:MAG: EAL domain-containing protein, partial [Gammaproteobacteria bacterium]|nr:EAL domain-containing protein [Gammaproteobacteria bacterium]
IILPRLANIESPKLIAENILQAFARPFSLVGRELIVTPSIGITVSPDDGSAPKLMLRNADTAMYKSKQRGRNTYHFFTQAMNEDVMRRLELEHHLLHALERGEFAVHYQPIIELAGRRPVGAEALLRWNNPELGSIPPDEFVILAEQKGLISEIGEFVIDTGCRLFNKLQNGADHPLYLTVNVSPQQFRRQGLPEAIGRILRQAGFPPHRLEVEVTEGLLLSEHGGIKADLELLREQGIRISLDDFGTGYSSLSYLRCFPFGVLKIDRSFITDLGNGPAAQGLIRAAIAMAHSLGLKVVAEGVETEAQRAFLEAEGCDMAQGYLFARPLDVDGFTGFLESWIQT